MSVIVQNKGSHVEFVDVVHALNKERDTITVQPGGKVTLPRNYRVAPSGVKRAHIVVTGNEAPVSPLNIKE